MKRREFIGSTAAGLAALATRRSHAAKAQGSKYRVAVIGRTGRGNYGHGLDIVWNNIEKAQVVAVADDDAQGRAAAARRLKAPTAYADYRQMLEKERLTIVGVRPWCSEPLGCGGTALCVFIRDGYDLGLLDVVPHDVEPVAVVAPAGPADDRHPILRTLCFSRV